MKWLDELIKAWRGDPQLEAEIMRQVNLEHKLLREQREKEDNTRPVDKFHFQEWNDKIDSFWDKAFKRLDR